MVRSTRAKRNDPSKKKEDNDDHRPMTVLFSSANGHRKVTTIKPQPIRMSIHSSMY